VDQDLDRFVGNVPVVGFLEETENGRGQVVQYPGAGLVEKDGESFLI
jgi:hypothetical protein